MVGDRSVFGNLTWVRSGLHKKDDSIPKVSPSRRFKRSHDVAPTSGYDSEASSNNSDDGTGPSLLRRIQTTPPPQHKNIGSPLSLLERVSPKKLEGYTLPSFTVETARSFARPQAPADPNAQPVIDTLLGNSRLDCPWVVPPGLGSSVMRKLDIADSSTGSCTTSGQTAEMSGTVGLSTSRNSSVAQISDDFAIPGLSASLATAVANTILSPLPPITPTNMCFTGGKMGGPSPITQEQFISRVRDLLIPLISQNAERRLALSHGEVEGTSLQKRKDLSDKARDVLSEDTCRSFVNDALELQKVVAKIKFSDMDRQQEHAQKGALSATNTSATSASTTFPTDDMAVPQTGPSSLPTPRQPPEVPPTVSPGAPRSMRKRTRSPSPFISRKHRDELPTSHGKDRATERRYSPPPDELGRDGTTSRGRRSLARSLIRRSQSPLRHNIPNGESQRRLRFRSPGHIRPSISRDRSRSPSGRRRYPRRYSPPRSSYGRTYPRPSSHRQRSPSIASPTAASSKGSDERPAHRLSAPWRRYSPVRREARPRGWTRTPPPRERPDPPSARGFRYDSSRISVKQEDVHDGTQYRHNCRPLSPHRGRGSPSPPARTGRRISGTGSSEVCTRRPSRSPSRKATKDREYADHLPGRQVAWIKGEESNFCESPVSMDFEVDGDDRSVRVQPPPSAPPPPRGARSDLESNASSVDARGREQVAECLEPTEVKARSSSSSASNMSKSVFDLLEEEDRKPNIHDLERLVTTTHSDKSSPPKHTRKRISSRVSRDEGRSQSHPPSPKNPLGHTQHNDHEAQAINGTLEAAGPEGDEEDVRPRETSSGLASGGEHQEEQKQTESEHPQVNTKDAVAVQPLPEQRPHRAEVYTQDSSVQERVPFEEGETPMDMDSDDERVSHHEPTMIVPCHFVPGVWLMQTGSKMIDTVDCRFTVDDITAKKWSLGPCAARSSLQIPSANEPDIRLPALEIRLLCFLTESVHESFSSLKEDASLTDAAYALHTLQQSWPPIEDFIVILNPKTSKERIWLSDDLPSASVDRVIRLEEDVHIGENTLRIIQLSNLTRFTFVLYACEQGQLPPSKLEEYLGQARSGLSKPKNISSIV